MTLRVPLTVVLVSKDSVRDVTDEAKDAQFRETASGGFASCTVDLDRPLSIGSPEIALFARLVVTDGRNGTVMFDGELEDPGRGANAAGQVWKLSAFGGAVQARDRKVPYNVVDRMLPPWVRTDGSQEKGTTSAGNSSGDVAALRLGVENGTDYDVGFEVGLKYGQLRESGQTLGRVGLRHYEGGPSTLWRWQVRSHPSATVLRDEDFSLSSVSGNNQLGVDIPDTDDVVSVRLYRTTIAGTANDDHWSTIINVSVRAALVDATGTPILSGYDDNTVLAHEVVADLLGRLLTGYDGANARIDEGTFPIEQLAYPDGVTAAQVLDDLTLLEPAFYWRVDELGPDGYRFQWRQWPTTVRYELDVTDDFDGRSVGELYNAVTVRWKDDLGNVRTTRLERDVRLLDDAGKVREDTIDLGDNLGSEASAVQAAEAFLDEHAVLRNAGTLTVSSPILDLDTGRMVMPWEIKAGHLIRVRNVLPHPDALNAAARDGATTYRIAARDFDARTGHARLELDTYPRTVSQALARLGKQLAGVRRR